MPKETNSTYFKQEFPYLNIKQLYRKSQLQSNNKHVISKVIYKS